MHDNESLQNRSFNIEKDIKQENLALVIDIANSFHLEENEIKSIHNGIYTLEETTAIRASLKILMPDMPLESDECLEEILKAQSSLYLAKQDYDNYINNSINRKLIFPEKSDSLHSELNQTPAFEKIMGELDESIGEGNTYDTYIIARDLKLLYPDKFEEIDLLNKLGKNGWQEKIAGWMNYLSENKNYYYDFATDLATAVNIVNFPNKILFDEEEWDDFKQYTSTFETEQNYVEMVEYLAKLKMISAKEVEITTKDMRLIF